MHVDDASEDVMATSHAETGSAGSSLPKDGSAGSSLPKDASTEAASTDDGSARAGAAKGAPTGAVDRRRIDVAHADTLGKLVSAHGSAAAFLASPYGAAYLTHRRSVCGWSAERVAAELGLRR